MIKCTSYIKRKRGRRGGKDCLSLFELSFSLLRSTESLSGVLLRRRILGRCVGDEALRLKRRYIHSTHTSTSLRRREGPLTYRTARTEKNKKKGKEAKCRGSVVDIGRLLCAACWAREERRICEREREKIAAFAALSKSRRKKFEFAPVCSPFLPVHTREGALSHSLSRSQVHASCSNRQIKKKRKAGPLLGRACLKSVPPPSPLNPPLYPPKFLPPPLSLQCVTISLKEDEV